MCLPEISIFLAAFCETVYLGIFAVPVCNPSVSLFIIVNFTHRAIACKQKYENKEVKDMCRQSSLVFCDNFDGVAAHFLSSKLWTNILRSSSGKNISLARLHASLLSRKVPTKNASMFCVHWRKSTNAD